MKRSAVFHTKTTKLCRSLKVRRYVAIGILESLWQLTAREAPLGDIGRLSNEDIATGIDYERNPDRLVDALVESDWLDRSPEHRLIVHDWHEHCEDSVKKFVSRNKLTFLSMSGHVEKSLDLSGHVSTNPDMSRLPLPLPLPLPNTNTAELSVPQSFDLSHWTERLYARHPKKKNKPLVEHQCRLIAEKASRARADPDKKFQEIDEVHRLWCKTTDWTKENFKYCPKLDEWLADEGFTQKPSGAAAIEPSRIWVDPVEEARRNGTLPPDWDELYGNPTEKAAN